MRVKMEQKIISIINEHSKYICNECGDERLTVKSKAKIAKVICKFFVDLEKFSKSQKTINEINALIGG